MSLLVETVNADASPLAGPLRDVVRTLDMNQPVFSLRTFSSYYERAATGAQLLVLKTATGMGLLGLTLALVGLYGLVAYSVARRTREIGIRMAIGAGRVNVLMMVLWQGMVLALAGILAGAILYEAVQRFRVLHPVSAPGMLIVALVGLAGNLANSAVLARDRGENLNLRVALTHTLADAAAAVGTIAASFVILTTGWVQADAAVSIGIAALILAGSWPPLHEAVRILMEGAPAHLSLTEVEVAMRGVPGVTGVHDLHIWSLTAGVEAVSGHVLVADPGEGQRVLRDLCRLLSDRYGLGHATLQLETEASSDPWHPNCAPGARAGSDR